MPALNSWSTCRTVLFYSFLIVLVCKNYLQFLPSWQSGSLTWPVIGTGIELGGPMLQAAGLSPQKGLSHLDLESQKREINMSCHSPIFAHETSSALL